MRQHGQRDHTVFSYYGPAQEKLLQDLVRLRTALQPYLQTQMARLAAEGRPFNRPLNYDFPEDPMTWQLADKGLGAQNEPSAPDRAPRPGDFIKAVECAVAPKWEMVEDTLRLAGGTRRLARFSPC